ncbi:MAG: SIMPL domain-containing protein [Candidatus Komeilibacteria bacterium]|nr:SIMPL domain-containing protein [Candidatus Komeilibacteria bacterium]
MNDVEVGRHYWRQPYLWIAAVLVLGIIALGVLSILREKIVRPDTNQVSVNAQSKVFARPDIAQVTFGVQTPTRKQANEAVKEGNATMNKVIAALREAGIEEQDIQTTQYSLNPMYSWPNGEQRLDGYQLYQQVSVKIRDLAIIGKSIESAANAGANQVGSIGFTIDDKETLKAQARAEAVAKAKDKAAAIQSESGIELGDIVNIYINDSDQPPVYYNEYAMGRGGDAGAQSAPDIQAGQLEVVVDVTLVYEVK